MSVDNWLQAVATFIKCLRFSQRLIQQGVDVVLRYVGGFFRMELLRGGPQMSVGIILPLLSLHCYQSDILFRGHFHFHRGFVEAQIRKLHLLIELTSVA